MGKAVLDFALHWDHRLLSVDLDWVAMYQTYGAPGSSSNRQPTAGSAPAVDEIAEYCQPLIAQMDAKSDLVLCCYLLSHRISTSSLFLPCKSPSCFFFFSSYLLGWMDGFVDADVLGAGITGLGSHGGSARAIVLLTVHCPGDCAASHSVAVPAAGVCWWELIVWSGVSTSSLEVRYHSERAHTNTNFNHHFLKSYGRHISTQWAVSHTYLRECTGDNHMPPPRSRWLGDEVGGAEEVTHPDHSAGYKVKESTIRTSSEHCNPQENWVKVILLVPDTVIFVKPNSLFLNSDQSGGAFHFSSSSAPPVPVITWTVALGCS